MPPKRSLSSAKKVASANTPDTTPEKKNTQTAPTRSASSGLPPSEPSLSRGRSASVEATDASADASSSSGGFVFAGVAVAVMAAVGWGYTSPPATTAQQGAKGVGKSPKAAKATPLFQGACGCYPPTKSGGLLRQLALAKKGTIAGIIAENAQDKDAFNDKIFKELAALSSTAPSSSSASSPPKDAGPSFRVQDCVGFYSLPSSTSRVAMDGPIALRNYLKTHQDPSKTCHVWVLDEVSTVSDGTEDGSEKGGGGGWTVDAWNGLKELFDQQTLAGEGNILSSASSTGLIVVRSEKDRQHLRSLGMPPRTGFVMTPIKKL